MNNFSFAAITKKGKESIYSQNKEPSFSLIGALLYNDRNDYIKNRIEDKTLEEITFDDLKNNVNLFWKNCSLRIDESGTFPNEDMPETFTEENLISLDTSIKDSISSINFSFGNSTFIKEPEKTANFNGVILLSKPFKDGIEDSEIKEENNLNVFYIDFYEKKKDVDKRLKILANQDKTLVSELKISFSLENIEEITVGTIDNNSDLHIVNNANTNKSLKYKTLGTNNKLLLGTNSEETYETVAKMTVLSNVEDKRPQIALGYETADNKISAVYMGFTENNGIADFYISGDSERLNFEIGGIENVFENSFKNSFINSRNANVKNSNNNLFLNSFENSFSGVSGCSVINSDNISACGFKNGAFINSKNISTENSTDNVLENCSFINASDNKFLKQSLDKEQVNDFINICSNYFRSLGSSGQQIVIGNDYGFTSGVSGNVTMIGTGLACSGLDTDQTQTIFGKFNKIVPSAIMIVGNGKLMDEKSEQDLIKTYNDNTNQTSTVARSNILEVSKEGLKLFDNTGERWVKFDIGGINFKKSNDEFSIEYKKLYDFVNQDLAVQNLQQTVKNLETRVDKIQERSPRMETLFVSAKEEKTETIRVEEFLTEKGISLEDGLIITFVNKPETHSFNVKLQYSSLEEKIENYNLNEYESVQMIYVIIPSENGSKTIEGFSIIQ